MRIIICILLVLLSSDILSQIENDILSRSIRRSYHLKKDLKLTEYQRCDVQMVIYEVMSLKYFDEYGKVSIEDFYKHVKEQSTLALKIILPDSLHAKLDIVQIRYQNQANKRAEKIRRKKAQKNK